MDYVSLPIEYIKELKYSFSKGLLLVPKDYGNTQDNWFTTKRIIPTDFVEHMELVQSLAINSKVALELGTRYATSTSALSYAKRLVTIDIEDCSEHIPKELDNIEVIQSDTLAFDYGSVFTPNSIDLVLIDTIHTYGQVKAEYNLIKRYLTNNAVVMFHDYNMPGVERAVQEIADSEGVCISVNGSVYPLAYFQINK